ncbi:TonB-dependent receptor [Flavisphingopyxis soli]|uniref:TonB-dependent receptor n=1 Tax=Flavisphingopyxis soli TaxID=2601267 RepID=UPI001F15CAAA|nr:TonB-dependent receptor [Sphingorhabdus soli]
MIALALQTGTSIVIADRTVGRRPVPAIHGQIDAGEALRRIAIAADARIVRVGPNAWRLIDRPKKPGRRPVVVRSPAPYKAPSQPETAATAPIIVTATKRDVNLRDVPAQTAIIDGHDLTLGGVGGTDKIVERLSSVSSTYLGSGRNKLFIRGIADSSFAGPTQATVGQYLGDLRLNYGSPDPDLRLSDVAKVEVLEGPQGTLYGAGSLGGIIRFVPNAPRPGEFEASAILGASATQEGDPSGDASLMINLPLDDGTTALRGTFDLARTGGFIDKPNIGKQSANRLDIAAARVAILRKLSPQWQLSISALGQDIDSADSQYADRSGDRLTNSASVPEGAMAKFRAAQAVVDGQLGALRLRSTTGWVGQSLEERYDASHDGEDRTFTQDTRSRMVSSETRIWMPERNGFGWLAGASVIHSTTTLRRRLERYDQRTVLTGVRNAIDEATVYGEVGIRLRDVLLASAGARVTWSHLSGAGEDVLPAIAQERVGVTAARSAITFLPSLSLTASLGDRTSLYLRYQESFRPGGLSVEQEFVKRFNDDHSQTFEIGGRYGLAERDTIDFSFNLAYTDWQDIQADFIDGAGLPSTANIGDGRIWSATVNAGWMPSNALRLELGATVNQSKVDPQVAFSLVRARQIPNIAGISARASAEWHKDLSSGRDVLVRAWLGYIGRSRLGIGPELGDLQGDYVDSGVTARLGSRVMGITLGVTNVTNARGNRFSLGTPFDEVRRQITPLHPRTVRVGIDYRF